MLEEIREAGAVSGRIALFTIASKNYLPYARVLLASVARVHPEYRLFLILSDRVDEYFDSSKEPFSVVQGDALGIPAFADMTLRYDVMEFSTAIKPYIFQWLFKTTDIWAAIYLDPDIRVYSRLDAVEKALDEGASVVLTPHITRPLEDGKKPNDYHMLQSGVFNLGFIAASHCQEALEFLGWWGRRLATQAIANFEKNLFTDQRWCDLAPCFLEHLTVLKDPGYNVAYWNLAHRDVRYDGYRGWLVGDVPLAFFHFSGVDADDAVSKHQNRLTSEHIRDCHELFDDYRGALLSAGWRQTKKWPYSYDYIGDGIRISNIVRNFFREVFPESVAGSREEIAEKIVAYCNQWCGIGFEQERPVVSRLMEYIYRQRPDLQSEFDIRKMEDRKHLVNWFGMSGNSEYGLADVWVSTSNSVEPRRGERHEAIECATGGIVRMCSHISYRALIAADRLVIHRLWRRLPNTLKPLASEFWNRLLRKLLSVQALRATEVKPLHNGDLRPSGRRGRVDVLLMPADIPQKLGSYYISNLMYLVWRSRPDLQKTFAIDTQEGQNQFANWYMVSAGREYGVSPVIPAYSKEVQISGVRETSDICGEPGANLIGYAHAELGMGEHVRMTAAALAGAEVGFGVVNFDKGIASRQTAVLEYGATVIGNRYKANIFHINADQMLLAYCHLGREFFAGRYNVGYWAWELAKCPEEWSTAIQMMDEIWAPSRFIQTAFAERSDVPVEYMPLCVTLPEVKNVSRASLGLPEVQFLFLCMFDYFSFPERKNPFGVIMAFKKAFPNHNSSVGLVVKIMNGDERSELWARMMALIDEDPRIIVINRTFDRDQVIGLFTVCDCYVSLHRSEGFGRGPAEAMYLGKPVIVTNYSGNTDFTLSDNSCLVDYRLIPVEQGQYPFHQEQIWADPDIGHAAWFMSRVYQDEIFCAHIGAKARRHIMENFSPKAVGAHYVRRLTELQLV